VAEKRKQYKNPPVVEAVCEIRFTPESQWDITVPGLVYGKIKGEFPLKEQHFIQEINFIPDRPNVPPKVENKELAVFLAEDKKTTIKLGIHTPRLIINRLKPYQSWGKFKPNIEKVFKTLKNTEGVELKGIQRIGLRYINIMEIPKKPGELVKSFEYRLCWGEEFTQDIWDFNWVSVIRFNSRDACKIQLASVLPGNPGNIGVRLDMDYYLEKPEAISPPDVLKWVEQAHDRVEDIFQGCITEDLKKTFEEVK